MNLQEIINLRMAGFISRAAAYLMTKLGTLNPNTAAKLQSGALEVVDAEIIHTFGIATGGTGGVFAVLDNSQTTINREIGISDFDKGRLDEDSYLAVNRVTLDYGGIAATYNAKNKVFSPAKYDVAGAARFPAEVLNARLRVYANNKPLFELPVDSIVLNGREFQGKEDLREMDIPKIIPGGTDIRIELITPGGTAISGTASQTHHFKLRFQGAVTKAAPGN